MLHILTWSFNVPGKQNNLKYFRIAGNCIPLLLIKLSRDVSSVGSERYLDRVEVTGSNPVRLTFTKSLF